MTVIRLSDERYSGTAIALHWLLVVLVVASFLVGLYMVGLTFSPRRLKLFNWHKWAGMVALGLAAVRLVWRLWQRPPAALPAPAWQHRVAHATHFLLYVLLFAVPLVGWAYTSATGFPVVLFGVLPLPDFVPVDKALAEAIKPWHERLSWVMAVLVLAHTGAALKHHFVDRDATLLRMWWARRSRA
jgi:cytochrome b561